MIKMKLENFDLAHICESGQCFRMTQPEANKYEIIATDKYLRAEQYDDEVTFYCSEEEFENFWKHYFDLDTDYQKFKDAVDEEDEYLNAAVKLGSGIRILNQDLWEMIVSFLISQQNNITRIRRCINNISMKYGEKKIAEDGTEYYAFPKPEAFLGLPEDALMECNLGYRSKYVVRTAKMVAEGDISLEDIEKMQYKEAKEELLKLYGVGKKVADCICLFALHDLEAFPIDTHINQALEAHYPEGFPFELYEGFEGVIQQYIFFYELFGK